MISAIISYEALSTIATIIAVVILYRKVSRPLKALLNGDLIMNLTANRNT